MVLEVAGSSPVFHPIFDEAQSPVSKGVALLRSSPTASRCTLGARIGVETASPMCSTVSVSRSSRVRPYTFIVRSGVECRASSCASLTVAPLSNTRLTYAVRQAWKSSFPPGPYLGMPAAFRSLPRSREVFEGTYSRGRRGMPLLGLEPRWNSSLTLPRSVASLPTVVSGRWDRTIRQIESLDVRDGRSDLSKRPIQATSR